MTTTTEELRREDGHEPGTTNGAGPASDRKPGIGSIGAPVEEPIERELTPPGGWVSFAIWAAAFAAFALVGYFFVVEKNVIVFDALDRLARAFLVWHNDPQKLAAIGFSFPPLDTIVFLPLAIFKDAATSLIALPLTSAFFAALAIVFLDRAFVRCGIPALLRYPLLIIVALNPLFLFYAGNGMGEAVYLSALALTLYAFVGWFTLRQPRFLIAAGIGLSMLVLTRYSFVYWAALISIAIVVAIASRRHADAEDEGAMIALLAPTVYGLTLWIFFNTVIADDMFGWLDGGAGQAVNVAAGAGEADISITDAIGRCLEVMIGVFPLAIVVVPGLIFAFFSRGSQLAAWLAAMIVLALAINGIDAYVSQEAEALALRNFLPALLATAVGAAWLYRVLDTLRIPVIAVAVVISLVSIPLTLDTMDDYPYQNLEQAFARGLTGGEDQEGTTSRGGFQVGVDPERQMAAYVNASVEDKDSVLTDNAHTFGVIQLSGEPDIFFDRIDQGDGVFREVLEDPYGEVDYMLVAKDNPNDLVAGSLETSDGSDPPGFATVFETERYQLYSVDLEAPEQVLPPALAPAESGGAEVTE